jgi:type VI secretion system secreted protein Hcp
MTLVLALAGSALAQAVNNTTTRSNTQHNIVLSIQGLPPKAVTAVSFSFAESPRDLASGQSAGRRQHEPITITKVVDKSSEFLARVQASGKHLTSVVIEFTRPDSAGRPQVYQVITLTDVLISSYKHGHLGDSPSEEISFTFQKIEYENKLGKTAAADSWSK